MYQNIHKQKGFYWTLFIALLIISIALITEFKKTLFVHESGTFGIFGIGGIILAIGLVLKWKYVRQILGVISMVWISFLTYLINDPSNEYLLAHGTLIIILVLILYLITFLEPLRYYVNHK